MTLGLWAWFIYFKICWALLLKYSIDIWAWASADERINIRAEAARLASGPNMSGACWIMFELQPLDQVFALRLAFPFELFFWRSDHNTRNASKVVQTRWGLRIYWTCLFPARFNNSGELPATVVLGESIDDIVLLPGAQRWHCRLPAAIRVAGLGRD